MSTAPRQTASGEQPVLPMRRPSATRPPVSRKGPASSRVAFYPTRRTTLRGHVAQSGQSVGLLIRRSWVRIPSCPLSASETSSSDTGIRTTGTNGVSRNRVGILPYPRGVEPGSEQTERLSSLEGDGGDRRSVVVRPVALRCRRCCHDRKDTCRSFRNLHAGQPSVCRVRASRHHVRSQDRPASACHCYTIVCT